MTRNDRKGRVVSFNSEDRINFLTKFHERKQERRLRGYEHEVIKTIKKKKERKASKKVHFLVSMQCL